MNQLLTPNDLVDPIVQMDESSSSGEGKERSKKQKLYGEKMIKLKRNFSETEFIMSTYPEKFPELIDGVSQMSI
jgi:hypothetical protein